MGAGITNGIIPSGGGSAAFRGALVELTSNETATVFSTTPIPWDTAEYDTDDIWSSGAPTRLTVPEGVTKVRLLGCVNFGVGSTSNKRYFFKLKRTGASTFVGNPSSDTGSNSDKTVALTLASPVLEVVGGDYFEATIFHADVSNKSILANASYFAMEIIA